MKGPKAMKLSSCGRFVVFESLYLDRRVVATLARWAAAHDLGLQDAIQLAVCTFNAGAPKERPRATTCPPVIERIE